MLWSLLLFSWACSAADPSQPLRVENQRLHVVPGGGSGAVYMDVINSGDSEDRLIRVEVEGVQDVQTHQTSQGEDGVARMRAAPDGFAVPANSSLKLERGGKHIMLLGIGQPLPQVGESVAVTLHFEKAGALPVEVPVREYGE
ncbi:MAG TPA: copper chaperone PCu(A)C [Acidobacteriota bacterium]|nr:copper chaperone PCu(A)C [Acidobacteriota bacterium]